MSIEEITAPKKLFFHLSTKTFFVNTFTNFKDIPGHFHENIEILGLSRYFHRVSAKYFSPISRFSCQFFGCFCRFFGKTFAYFQVSSKKFHQISTYRFRNFRTNVNIRRFSDTKMGALSHFDTCINTNK